jgi:quinol monooxygenase YgiN
MISVIARLTIREGQTEAAIGLIKTLMTDVAHEEGTSMYTLNQNKKKPSELVIMERYADKAALARHSATDHFKRFNEQIAGLLAAKPVVDIMEEIHAV